MMSRSVIPYSVRRLTCVLPSRLAAVGGNGASRRVEDGVERAGRTVLAYVRGAAGEAVGGTSGRLSVCLSRTAGASGDDQKPVVSAVVPGRSIGEGEVAEATGVERGSVVGGTAVVAANVDFFFFFFFIFFFIFFLFLFILFLFISFFYFFFNVDGT